jgi:hypothetical protein
MNEIKPKEWANPDRQGYLGWVYKTFNYEDSAKDKLFTHQKFVRDFIQYDSPYRGMLLYHGLGSGKTASSIIVSEAFIANGQKVIVLLPASLQNNYRDEIMRYASVGNPSSKMWNLVNVKKAKTELELELPTAYLKKFTKIWYPMDYNIPGNAIEKHNVAWVALDSSEKEAAMNTLKQIIDKKFTFINYNGLTQKAVTAMSKDYFENALVIIDEAHNFISRVVNRKKIASTVYKKIIGSNSKVVLLTGTPIINHPYELTITLNLLRGYMNVFEFTFLKASKVPTIEEIETILYDADVLKYIDHRILVEAEKKLFITFLPDGYIDDNNSKMKPEKWGDTLKEVIDIIQRALNTEFKLSKRHTTSELFALPTLKEDFDKLFLDESDPENPKVKNMDLFTRRIMGLVSYTRTIAEGFPELLPKVVETIPMSDYQLGRYLIVRDEERQIERRNRNAGRGGVMGQQTSVYRAFSRMACNFVFPEAIKRPFPKDLRKVMQHEMDLDVESDSESEKSDEKKKDVNKGELKKKYEDTMKKSLTLLDEKADEYLTIDKLATLYSPKFARIIKDVNESIGKVLVYSQFRTIEGLGVLKLALKAAGYAEIRVAKSETTPDKWHIVNADKVLDSMYDNKRYIEFDTDATKAAILLQLYNGNYSNIENTLPSNLRGELFKIFMITQSGAEGISLKNVRNVIITEPFWNMVRIDQVIGRACRAGSHIELPENERNVKVSIYTCIFTQKQLKDNFLLRSLDNSLTSDTHILRAAEKKDAIIQAFLNKMKAGAVDCRNNAIVNEPLANGFKCYAFPLPVQEEAYSYIPDIKREGQTQQRLERVTKVQGRVISYKGKKYVAVDEYPSKYFDYDAYKFAGVLQETQIKK